MSSLYGYYFTRITAYRNHQIAGDHSQIIPVFFFSSNNTRRSGKKK